MKARIFTEMCFKSEQTIIAKRRIFTIGSSMGNQKKKVFNWRKSVFFYTVTLGKLLNLSKFVFWHVKWHQYWEWSHRIVVSIKWDTTYEISAQSVLYRKPRKILATIVVLILSVFIFTEIPDSLCLTGEIRRVPIIYWERTCNYSLTAVIIIILSYHFLEAAAVNIWFILWFEMEKIRTDLEVFYIQDLYSILPIEQCGFDMKTVRENKVTYFLNFLFKFNLAKI